MIRVAFDVGDKVRILRAPSLEVVRLVASVSGLGVVDVEPFPGRVDIRATGVTGTGANEELAAQDFLRRVLT